MSDATLQHWVPSPDGIAAAPMKKKGQKRPRDDPSASENPETVPDEAGATDWAEVSEPSQRRRSRMINSLLPREVRRREGQTLLIGGSGWINRWAGS